MHFVIFISSLSSGGAERVAVNIAKAWSARGDKVTLITLAPIEMDFYTLDPQIQRIGLDLFRDSRNSFVGIWENVRRVWCLRRQLKRLKPDVVVGMGTSSNILAVLASLGLACCVVVAEHIYPPMFPLSPIWERLRRWTYPHASVVLALTDESRKWIKENCPGSHVAMIPNAIQLPLSDGKSRIEPEEILPDSRRLILAVGRLTHQKGFDFLIDAFCQIADAHLGWDLVILGEGEERQKLLAKIAYKGLLSRVFLPGTAGNIASWYERADIFVMSSRFEGFPCTLVEAMAHKLAVVSFDCDTGPRDIIRHEIDGYLVPSGDVTALAAKLDQLVGDEIIMKRYAELAVEVRERFSMERILKEWDNVIRDTKNILIVKKAR